MGKGNQDVSIIGENDIGPSVCLFEVDHDPTTVATNAPAGSMIVRKDGSAKNGAWYRKLDDGATTNVVEVSG